MNFIATFTQNAEEKLVCELKIKLLYINLHTTKILISKTEMLHTLLELDSSWNPEIACY